MPGRRQSASPDRAFEWTCHKRSGTESNKVRSRSSRLVGDMIEAGRSRRALRPTSAMCFVDDAELAQPSSEEAR
jgi:hypothetical protein